MRETYAMSYVLVGVGNASNTDDASVGTVAGAGTAAGDTVGVRVTTVVAATDGVVDEPSGVATGLCSVTNVGAPTARGAALLLVRLRVGFEGLTVQRIPIIEK